MYLSRDDVKLQKNCGVAFGVGGVMGTRPEVMATAQSSRIRADSSSESLHPVLLKRLVTLQ